MGGSVYIVLVVLCLLYVSDGLPRVDPVVDTNVGTIRGLPASDGDYSMFLGIPFATVDSLNPFGPSIPHPIFNTTFDAIDDSVVCPQRDEFNNTLVGSLDCLRLNVYVPDTASSYNRRPVLVWIHGGGFSRGYAKRFKHGPKFLVRHDVVVVTINYRLGAYGFLCLDDPRVPGNQGFKDQLAALRWIKSNIEAFGGDSNQITIAGQSAGGVSVDFHLTYTNEDLFHNIILQSGTGFAPFIVNEIDPTSPMRLAAQLGVVTDSLDVALDFLRTVDTDLIIEASAAAGVMSRPCAEREFEGVERFITDQPTRVSIPQIRNVSVLIGFVSNERGGSFEHFSSEQINAMNSFVAMLGMFNFESDHLASMAANMRLFYIGDEELSKDVEAEILDFHSDFGYYNPSHRRMQSYIENGASTIYHYVFAYDGGRNFEKVKSNMSPVPGAVHEDELGYLFDMAIFDETITPEDQLVIDRITTLWTNFVKYSNPIPEASDLLPVQWPAITSTTLPYLEIDSEVTLKDRPFNRRMAHWELFYRLNNPF